MHGAHTYAYNSLASILQIIIIFVSIIIGIHYEMHSLRVVRVELGRGPAVTVASSMVVARRKIAVIISV